MDLGMYMSIIHCRLLMSEIRLPVTVPFILALAGDEYRSLALSCAVKYYGAHVQGHLGYTFRNDLSWSRITLLPKELFVAIFSCLLHFSAAEVMQLSSQ